MKKLTTLLGIVALSATFAVAGCNKKKAEEAPAPAAATKPAEPTPPAAPPAEAPKPPEEAKPAEPAAATPPVADLPADCTAYKATIEKIGTCDKVKADDKAKLKTAFDKDFTAWTAAGADKAKASAGCKGAVDAIKAAHGKDCSL